MALEDYCASCTYLGESCNYDGKYYCDKKGPVYACDPKCGNYCEAYSRSNSARENMYEMSRTHQSSGCYITTMVCAKLGYNDNCYHLQKLRYLRNKMQKSPCDMPLLLLYDQVGPLIAKSISEDPNSDKISYRMYRDYITKAVEAIEDKNERLAKDLYIFMTETLANYYGIDSRVIKPDKVDSKELGHGLTKCRIISE